LQLKTGGDPAGDRHLFFCAAGIDAADLLVQEAPDIFQRGMEDG